MSEARSLQKLRRLLASGADPRAVAHFVIEHDIEHGNESWRTSLCEELKETTAVKEARDKEWEKETAVRAASEPAAMTNVPAVFNSPLRGNVVAMLAATTLTDAAIAASRLCSARSGYALSSHQSGKDGDGTRGASELRFLSIFGKEAAAVELLCNAHPDAREIRSNGSSCPTPLAEAAMGGHLQFAEVLLEHGADVNLQEFDEHGKPTEGTALHYAARHGHPRLVSCLLQHGASTMARNQDGLTALEWCKPYVVGWDTERERGAAVVHLLSLSTPPLRSWWVGTIPTSAALAIQFRCGERTVDLSIDCSGVHSGSKPSGGEPTHLAGFHRLSGDLLRLVAGWLAAEDANELARTCLGLYAVVMQHERSARLECSACLAQLRRRPVVPLRVEEVVRTLRDAQSVPLCRVAMDRSGVGAIVARGKSGTIDKWGAFDSLLRVLSPLRDHRSSSRMGGSDRCAGDAAMCAVLSLMASMIDSGVKMRHAQWMCGHTVESSEHENGVHWLSRLVAYTPVASEACQLVEKLCDYDRTSDTIDTCGYFTEEIMEAHCVEAIVEALQFPAACAAAAYALAAVVGDELSMSTDSSEGLTVTRAIELGAVPLLLTQAIAAELVAATAALHALGTLCSASPVAATIAHRAGFIRTLVELMRTHEPSKQHGHKAARVALVAEAARTLRHLVGDTNGCDELISDLRCEEMLTAGARDALAALLASPGAAGEAEATMTWLPLPHVLEHSTTHTWLQAGAPQDGDDELNRFDGDDELNRFREMLMHRLATDCIELGLRVPELVHCTTEHWSLAHDVHHGRYHKVRRAVIDAANRAVERRGGVGNLRSIYYKRLEEGEGNIDGAVLGTHGRILCHVRDEFDGHAEALHLPPTHFSFRKGEHDGVVECFAGFDSSKPHPLPLALYRFENLMRRK